MPVRSFLIQDILDNSSDNEADNHSTDNEGSANRLVIAATFPIDYSLPWKEHNLAEVPLPIYIRNDQKFQHSWPPKRRIRTVFTAQQIASLEKRFQSQHYLTAVERSELASKLNLSAIQIKTWFQNRRMKWKKTCQ